MWLAWLAPVRCQRRGYPKLGMRDAYACAVWAARAAGCAQIAIDKKVAVLRISFCGMPQTGRGPLGGYGSECGACNALAADGPGVSRFALANIISGGGVIGWGGRQPFQALAPSVADRMLR